MEAYSLRQHALSTNLERLLATTDNISLQYEDHSQAISKAKNMTNEIFESLEGVARTAVMIEEADRLRWGGSGFGGWVPYIVSPAATLFLGSYGLAPSGTRNFGLIALGELLGFGMTHFKYMTVPWTMLAFNGMAANTTVTTL